MFCLLILKVVSLIQWRPRLEHGRVFAVYYSLLPPRRVVDSVIKHRIVSWDEVCGCFMFVERATRCWARHLAESFFLLAVKPLSLPEVCGTRIGDPPPFPSSTDRENKTTTNVLWIRNWRTLLHMLRADAALAVTWWQHFSDWNDVMGAILKLWRHVTPTRRRTTRWEAI